MVRSDSLVVGIPARAIMNLLAALKTSFQITLAPLSIDRVHQEASHPGNGAVVVMSSSVRDNNLKHNAPIWEKEHRRDGSSAWVSMGACQLSARGC